MKKETSTMLPMRASRRHFLKTASKAGLFLPIAAAFPGAAFSRLLAPQNGADKRALRAAQAGIEKHRKGRFRIRFRDANGDKLAGQTIRYSLAEHQFRWGFNATLDPEKATSHEEQVFLHYLQEAFNSITVMRYWAERKYSDANLTELFQGHVQEAASVYSVNTLKGLGFSLKGHPLYWPVEKGQPPWLSQYDLKTKWKFVETHVRKAVALHAGQLSYWDAVNESLWEPVLEHLPNRQWPHLEAPARVARDSAKILQWAREEDPLARYLLNDYGLNQDLRPNLQDYRGKPVTAERQRRRYRQIAEEMAEVGQAPDALGMQCHTGGLQNPASQQAFLQEMAESGFPLHITEFWAHYEDIQAQDGTITVPDDGHWKEKQVERKGEKLSQQELDRILTDFVENYMTIAFGEPALEAFSFWGQSALFERHGRGLEALPQYERIRHVIREKWHTSGEATTDGEGFVEVSGFYGDYRFETDFDDRGPVAEKASLRSNSPRDRQVWL